MQVGYIFLPGCDELRNLRFICVEEVLLKFLFDVDVAEVLEFRGYPLFLEFHEASVESEDFLARWNFH